MPERLRLPDRHARHPARRRRAGERQPALHPARARAPAQRRRRRDHRHLRRLDPDAGRDHRPDAGQDRGHPRPRRRQRLHHPLAGGRSAARRLHQARRRARGRRDAALRAGRARRRRHPVLPVHRRHHRPLEGRGALPPQPRRQHRAVQGVPARGDRPGRGGARAGAAALPHLRADDDARLRHHRRPSYAHPEPARHGRLHRRDQGREALGAARGQHPLPGADHAPAVQGDRPLELQDRHRRRLRGDQGDVGEVEGADRPPHQGGLRPLRDLADPLPEPDRRSRVLGRLRPAAALDRDRAPRRRGPSGRRGRGRRDLRPRAAGDARLLEQRAGQRRRLHRRGLLPHRRRRRSSPRTASSRSSTARRT